MKLSRFIKELVGPNNLLAHQQRKPTFNIPLDLGCVYFLDSQRPMVMGCDTEYNIEGFCHSESGPPHVLVNPLCTPVNMMQWSIEDHDGSPI